MRDAKGKWIPGSESPNAGGRPTGILTKLREEFAGDIPAIMRVWRQLALGETPIGYEYSEIKTSDRFKAGSEYVSRIIGRTPQTINVGPGAPVVDMTKLTEAQLEALAAIEFVTVSPDDVTEH